MLNRISVLFFLIHINWQRINEFWDFVDYKFSISSDPLDPHNLIKDQEFWNLLLQIRSSKSFFFPDPDDPYKLTEDTRTLGLVVCRGTSVVLICPADGMEAIANPFVQQEWWESESKRSSRTSCFQFCTILAANVEMMTSWKITMKCKYCHQTLVIKLTFLSFYAVGRHTCTCTVRKTKVILLGYFFSPFFQDTA